jgi:F0F1-type ATP synthase membrane subunit b/b'
MATNTPPAQTAEKVDSAVDKVTQSISETTKNTSAAVSAAMADASKKTSEGMKATTQKVDELAKKSEEGLKATVKKVDDSIKPVFAKAAAVSEAISKSTTEGIKNVSQAAKNPPNAQ